MLTSDLDDRSRGDAITNPVGPGDQATVEPVADRIQIVVVADDHAGLRTLVHNIIESPDCDVLEASDGNEAWDLIKARKPDLVLLDLNMPFRSGLEVLQSVRADPELRGTQVMILTSSDSQTDVDAGILAGADFYVTKPFSASDLLARVSEAMGHRIASARAKQSSRPTEGRRDPMLERAGSNGNGPAGEQDAISPETAEKIALGKALAARVHDVTRMTIEAEAAAGLSELSSPRFAKPTRHVHTVATRGVARMLIAGQNSTEKERNFIGRLGVMSAIYGLPVATLVRSSHLWRDAILEVLDEEAARLGTDPSVRADAHSTTTSSVDTAIVQLARAYDSQMDVIGRREDAATGALHTTENRLEAAVADVTSKNALLEIASRQQTEFIANVSHELRTPLADILGSAEIILESAAAELGAQERLDVKQIETSARVVLRLVNDILDQSLLEADKMVLDRHNVDLGKLIDFVLAMVRTTAHDRNLYLRSEIGEGALVWVDEVRIRQVVTNLVGNALKFTATGGITVRCVSQGDHWRVEVSDTGIGIPPQSHERVFERFGQLDTTTTRHFGGAGLGLTIARRLVQLHGGEMGLDSQVGAGSTFWFTLPSMLPPV
ncbi:MAG TPA: ATP-binding protein [Candidatus Dormibacteraeota bacterium]|nr:ATP-binding protein [Candidatus Dormibacteraeota bacterium]